LTFANQFASPRRRESAAAAVGNLLLACWISKFFGTTRSLWRLDQQYGHGARGPESWMQKSNSSSMISSTVEKASWTLVAFVELPCVVSDSCSWMGVCLNHRDRRNAFESCCQYQKRPVIRYTDTLVKWSPDHQVISPQHDGYGRPLGAGSLESYPSDIRGQYQPIAAADRTAPAKAETTSLDKSKKDVEHALNLDSIDDVSTARGGIFRISISNWRTCDETL
jgi:hypothetical protein